MVVPDPTSLVFTLECQNFENGFEILPTFKKNVNSPVILLIVSKWNVIKD